MELILSPGERIVRRSRCNVAILLLVELILSQKMKIMETWKIPGRNPSFSGTYSLTRSDVNDTSHLLRVAILLLVELILSPFLV